MNSKKRIYYYDNIKILAFLFVLIIHISSWYIYNINIDIGTYKGLILNFFEAIARPAVPLFLMVFGAILYDNSYKIDDEKKFYKKKFINIFIPFIIVAFITYFFEKYTKTNIIQTASVKELIKKLLNHDYYYHFWYVYMIIELLIIGPISKKIINNLNKKTILEIILIVLFVPTIILEINNVAAFFNHNLSMYIFSNGVICFGYTLLGYYISKYNISRKSLKLINYISIISIIINMLFVQFSYKRVLFENYYSYCTIGIVIQSIAIFEYYKKNNNSKKIYSRFSYYTYYAYLIHVCVINYLIPHLKSIINITNFNSFLLNYILDVFISFAITISFGYIFFSIDKFIKKLLNRKKCIE